ncbi:MAG: hypothetical protein HY814_03110 [Candidatus Riflebacteria bacterium]|nr:hypothetical protein [Candidatus Riflebacteria bacterium]
MNLNANNRRLGGLGFLTLLVVLLGTTPAPCQEPYQTKDIHLVHVDRDRNIFIQHIPGHGLDINVTARETRRGLKVTWTATDDHPMPGTERYPAVAYARIYRNHGGHFRSYVGHPTTRWVTAREALGVARRLAEVSPDCSPCRPASFLWPDYGSLLIRTARDSERGQEDE